MKTYTKLFFVLAAGSLLLSGCGKKPAKELRFEQLELTARFFENISAGKNDLAVRQGEKLYTLNPDADHILLLIGMQQSNDAINKAARLLEKNQVNEALHVIREASNKYENNRELATVSTRLYQLRNAQKLLRAIKRAKNSSAMRSARLAARAGLSRNMTPELEKFLNDCELKEAAAAAREKAAAIEADKAAQRAALQAKIDEQKRRQADARFASETAAKTAAGERARRNATDRPIPQTK